MGPDSRLRLRELFAAAVLVEPEKRSSFLDRNCGDDLSLRREVESLLDQDAGPGEGESQLGEVVGAAIREVADPPATASPSSLKGHSVGRIRILELLGEGGMGEVYVGFDETLERRVALKAIRARHRLDAGSRARFLREARILSQLEHPNICRIHDYIEGEERDFLVLELIEGSNLSDRIVEGLGSAEKLRVAIQIAEVLEAAHGKGVVHRDLKPQNVMVTPEGETKVLDFGLARSGEPEAGFEQAVGEPGRPERGAGADRLRLIEPVHSSDGTALMPEDSEAAVGEPSRLHTRRGQIVGTPVYMSPEQANGEAVGTASDMSSFGLVLQTLFTEEAPYPTGLDTVEILERARRGETLPVSGIDQDLAALIERLKSSAPAARPNAVSALERLRWIRDKPRRRLRRLVAAGAVVVIALGAAKYTFDLKAARDVAERRRSQAEGLIGFMIGDLRSRLAPVNRLEVLDEIGVQALEYFAAVPAAELSAEEILFRSQTLSQIGQVRMDQGDLAASLEAFEESLQLARDLVERNPKNGDWVAWLGAAHFWVGSVDWSRGELDRALTSFRAYLDVARSLVELDPENPDWQLELSYALNNIGSVLVARGEAEAASEAFRASLEIKKRLVAAQPENTAWQSELAGTHSWLGQALYSSSDLAGAFENFEANLSTLTELQERDSANTRLRFLLGIAHEKVGLVLEATGRPNEAQEHFGSYQEAFRELVRVDPDNSNWREELAVSHRRVGQLRLLAGDLPSAEHHLRSSEEILSALVSSDPANDGWKTDLIESRLALGPLALAQGDAQEATRLVRAAAAEIYELVGEQRDLLSRGLRSKAAVTLGEIQLTRGLTEESRLWFELALESVEDPARSLREPVHRLVQVRALLGLDRVEEARGRVEELYRDGIREVGFVELCREKGVWPASDG